MVNRYCHLFFFFFFLISRIFHIVFSWDCHPFPWFLPFIRFSSALIFASNDMNNNRVWNFIMILFAKKHTVAWTDPKKSSPFIFWNLVRHEHTIQNSKDVEWNLFCFFSQESNWWSSAWITHATVYFPNHSSGLQNDFLNVIIFVLI